MVYCRVSLTDSGVCLCGGPSPFSQNFRHPVYTPCNKYICVSFVVKHHDYIYRDIASFLRLNDCDASSVRDSFALRKGKKRRKFSQFGKYQCLDNVKMKISQDDIN